VPRESCFLHWIATWGNIWIVDNLQKLTIMFIVGVVCEKVVGSQLSIFYPIFLAQDICSFVFALFGVIWVMPKTVQQMLERWQRRHIIITELRFGKKFRCVLWTIRRKRNRRTFDSVEHPNPVIKQIYPFMIG
jgi:hypothetical protein